MSEISQTSTRTHHSASVVLSDPVQKEWRRLLQRLRRKGAIETATHVALLIRKRAYPLWYPHQLVDYLLKRGELKAAEVVLNTVKRSGESSFLIDDLWVRWLRSYGDRTKAIRFAEKKAKSWSHSCLYFSLSAMYELVGNRAKKQKCDEIASSLAAREVADHNRKSKQAKA